MIVSLACTVLLAVATAEADKTPWSVDRIVQQSTESSGIDRAVSRRLQMLGIRPAEVCADPVFVRRVFLDVIGTLPTVRETREFLAAAAADKRRALIDRLLERPEFADCWAMKWSDLLRVKSEFPINLWPNAAQAYHEWIRSSIRQSKPYDRFVRELITASGSNFRVPPVNFYRALQSRTPDAIARAVALAFMGVRAERWPKQRLAGMATFFSRVAFKRTAEWKEEIVYSAAPAGQADARSARAVFPDGSEPRLSPTEDPRVAFADWLTAPSNPWFARSIANRVWYWLLGRGIVHEPDDIRPDNPPRNPELLQLLERELIRKRYDIKHLFRIILNTKTYQRSSIPRTKHPASSANFASYMVRRLDAEVLMDALCQVTGTMESYSSAIPEPFTFVPEDQRSIALPDGSITSPFLEMFGRPPRDTGLESERNNRPTAAQRLHLLNSSHVLQKIERGSMLRALLRARRSSARQIVDTLYLTILSRYPTSAEWQLLASRFKNDRSARRNTVVDLAWALINSAEFQYRH